jgi:hypothetical protein
MYMVPCLQPLLLLTVAWRVSAVTRESGWTRDLVAGTVGGGTGGRWLEVVDDKVGAVSDEHRDLGRAALSLDRDAALGLDDPLLRTRNRTCDRQTSSASPSTAEPGAPSCGEISRAQNERETIPNLRSSPSPSDSLLPSPCPSNV